MDKKNSEDYQLLVDYFEKNIETEVLSEEYLNRVLGLAEQCAHLSGDLLERFKRVLIELDASISDKKQRAIVRQCQFLLSIRIGFQPKIIHYALEILNSSGYDVRWKRLANITLGDISYSCGMYQEAYDYYLKSLDNIDYEQIEQLIETYSKLAILAQILEKDRDIIIYKEKIGQINRDNSLDSNQAKKIEYLFDINYYGCKIYLNDIEKNDIDEYIQSFKKYLSVSYDGIHAVHNVTEDVSVIERIINEGFIVEAEELVRLIIDHRNCFTGPVIEIAKGLKQLVEEDEEWLSKEEQEEYQEIYFELLYNYYDEKEEIMNQVSRDAFSVHRMKKNYDLLKEKLANDSLTNAKSRAAFNIDIVNFYNEEKEGYIVFIDIDGLKRTNDNYGHKAGDSLLAMFVTLASRKMNPDTDALYRYAGDEFVILSSGTYEEIIRMMEMLEQELKQGFLYEGNNIINDFSYGISRCTETAIYTDEAEAINNLVKLADKRMYECKSEHKNTRR